MVGRGLRTLFDGLDHPEGVCWSETDGALYAGGEAGQLYRGRLDDGGHELIASIEGGFMLGLALDGEGAVYVCDPGNRCVQRISPDGAVARHGDAIGYPNYPVFDDAGRLWVSDSGGWESADGAVMRIDRDGRTERVLEGLRFANGLAIRGEWLYVVESAWPRVIRIPLTGGEPEPVIELSQVVPDGLAFDEEEGLWIGCWQPNRIYRLGSDGTLETIVDDWSGEYVLTPTNLAFAGADLGLLALASLGGWAVKAIDPGVRGAPLHHPQGVGA
ncbi:MAG: SMP-30/gluconolactonase/LRE family protein [Solirubrobacterales bacterium]|nr:SMP-30/gluconolactonase/LRE family protein [Solirubrobacterales bacterium]